MPLVVSLVVSLRPISPLPSAATDHRVRRPTLAPYFPNWPGPGRRSAGTRPVRRGSSVMAPIGGAPLLGSRDVGGAPCRCGCAAERPTREAKPFSARARSRKGAARPRGRR